VEADALNGDPDGLSRIFEAGGYKLLEKTDTQP